jgi:hypothetical protein
MHTKCAGFIPLKNPIILNKQQKSYDKQGAEPSTLLCRVTPLNDQFIRN